MFFPGLPIEIQSYMVYMMARRHDIRTPSVRLQLSSNTRADGYRRRCEICYTQRHVDLFMSGINASGVNTCMSCYDRLSVRREQLRRVDTQTSFSNLPVTDAQFDLIAQLTKENQTMVSKLAIAVAEIKRLNGVILQFNNICDDYRALLGNTEST